MADMPELLEKLDALHKGRQIVFTNGCYDICIRGVMDLLEQLQGAGRCATVLRLNSDESVKRQGKGDDRPVNPYPVRAFVLATRIWKAWISWSVRRGYARSSSRPYSQTCWSKAGTGPWIAS